MDRVKEIQLKVLPAKVANEFVKKHHYSGKVVPNSTLHFGAFLDGKLHGVMQYGSSLDKRKIIGLVEGTGWNEFLELNRMAFDDFLPRNSESYCIARSMKLIAKHAPHIKWVVSFADGCQCGDGTIYRASNFVLTGITEGHSFWKLPNGESYTSLTMRLHGWGGQLAKCCSKGLFDEIMGTNWQSKERLATLMKTIGAEKLNGFSFRYIYFIDKSCRQKLTVPEIPFSKIDELGAGMYKGENISRAERNAKITEKD